MSRPDPGAALSRQDADWSAGGHGGGPVDLLARQVAGVVEGAGIAEVARAPQAGLQLDPLAVARERAAARRGAGTGSREHARRARVPARTARGFREKAGGSTTQPLRIRTSRGCDFDFGRRPGPVEQLQQRAREQHGQQSTARCTSRLRRPGGLRRPVPERRQ